MGRICVLERDVWPEIQNWLVWTRFEFITTDEAVGPVATDRKIMSFVDEQRAVLVTHSAKNYQRLLHAESYQGASALFLGVNQPAVVCMRLEKCRDAIAWELRKAQREKRCFLIMVKRETCCIRRLNTQAELEKAAFDVKPPRR